MDGFKSCGQWPSGNVQWFAERPQMFEDPNDGSRKLFVSGHLHGEGVGTAPNEWGTLIILSVDKAPMEKLS